MIGLGRDFAAEFGDFERGLSDLRVSVGDIMLVSLVLKSLLDNVKPLPEVTFVAATVASTMIQCLVVNIINQSIKIEDQIESVNVRHTIITKMRKFEVYLYKLLFTNLN